MQTKSELDRTLGALRTIWKEGNDLMDTLQDGNSDLDWAAKNGMSVGYIGGVGMYLKNLFHNHKFFEDFDALIKNDGYDQHGDLNGNCAVAIAISYIKNLGRLLKGGYIKDPYSGINNDDSRIGFVAMWFNESMEGIYCNGIKLAIERLGYESVRIDKQEHNDRIDQRIFEQIRKARFLVADLTANRAGVYYEAGFAAGQGIPVIHICKDTDFDSRHFDVKTYNTIKYNNDVDLCKKLVSRIEGTIGRYKRMEASTESSMTAIAPF